MLDFVPECHKMDWIEKPLPKRSRSCKDFIIEELGDILAAKYCWVDIKNCRLKIIKIRFIKRF